MSKQDYRELEAYRALGRPEELCKKQGWISVKDKLPEDDGPVINVYHFKGNTVRYISTLSYFCFDPQPHWQHESTGLVVTHWMPLPEPPKEDNNG